MLKPITLFAALALAAPVSAAILVDTGPGTTGPAWSLSTNQSLAGVFNASPGFVVTDAEGWIGTIIPGTFAVSIYPYVGGIPTTPTFSATFTGGDIGTAQWTGAHGLNWKLPAGYYWVGFSAVDGFASMTSPSPSPLGAEAFTLGGAWQRNDDLDIGVRLSGEVVPFQSSVPEPAAWAIMLAGFGAIGASMRSRRVAVSFS